MDKPLCEICGEPMPDGESMFKFHGHSGPCPKPPLPPKGDTSLQGMKNKMVQHLATLDQLEAGLREGDQESVRIARDLIRMLIQIGTPNQLNAMLAGVRGWAEMVIKTIKEH